MSDKKVIDIVPPKTMALKPERKPFKKRPNFLNFAYPLILGVAILAFILMSSLWVSATVVIAPRFFPVEAPQSEIGFEQGISLNGSLKKIPVEVKSFEEEVSLSFSSSGKTLVEKKATGKIVIYNNFSEASQVLVKDTRFLSAEGKLFRLDEKVTVPGGRLQAGKLAAGSIEAKVTAAEPGEDYNIGSSTFSIPGFAGSSKYTGFYAKSFSEMFGGLKGETVSIAAEDIENAKKSATETILSKLKQRLGQETEGTVVLPDAVSEEILAVDCLAQVGDAAKSFSVSVKGKISAFVFKNQDIEEMARLLISNAIASQQPVQNFFSGTSQIKPGSSKIDLEVKEKDLSLKRGKLVFNVRAESYQEINQEALFGELAGKPLAEAEKTLVSFGETIEKSDVSIWPFWINKLPLDKDKIKLKIAL